MSKFDYKAEGKLTAQYLLELLNDYIEKLMETNNIEATGAEVDQKSSKKNSLANGINNIKQKIDIFLQTNVLTSRQVFDLKQNLKAINFDMVLTLIDYNRENAIKRNQKEFLTVLKDIKCLDNVNSNYILFNSPVEELKPFLSDKVAEHKVDYLEVQKLIKQFMDVQHSELNNFDFEPYTPTFSAKREDFYKTAVIDSGVGEEVEAFIRSRMIEKLELAKQENSNDKIIKIDNLLKKLKLNKIEKMMEDLIDLQTNLANVKEVVDSCKETLSTSTIPNKPQIFLIMDNLYYKLSKKCEDLKQQTKRKLQSINKQKLFSSIDNFSEQDDDKDELQSKTPTPKQDKPADRDDDDYISANLYDDDEEDDEINVTEDADDEAEDEIVIDEE